MSKSLCIFCSSKSISSAKSVRTFKQKKLSKVIKIFGGVQIVKSKNKISICKDCFHEASVACKFYEKFEEYAVIKRLPEFFKEQVESKSQNFSLQTVSQKFILILNQIPKELIPKDLSEERLKSIFCKYGTISHVYVSDGSSYTENYARITFVNEQTSFNKRRAIQDQVEEVYGSQVAATLISENDSPIDFLSDGCLQKIFLSLREFEDQLNIERVCQRWRKLGSICWTNLKSLYYYNCKFNISIDKWEKIVIQSKESLEEIQIDASENAERQLKAVENNCDNLKNLVIRSFDGSPKEFEEYVKPLFEAKQKLRHLLLDFIPMSCNFSILSILPENMVEIHIYARYDSTNSQMNFSKFCNLRVLYLFSFEFTDENDLSGLENLVNLEHLSLANSTVHRKTFEKIKHFTKLRYLEIPSQTVDDNILSIIIRNNQNLEYLDISNNPNILNNTLRTIGELPKLSELIMKNLHGLDGFPLGKMYKLVELNCRGCSSITDWELMTLIDNALNLQIIDVSNCNVTMRLLVSAEHCLKKRRRMNRKITIYISNEEMITIWSKIYNKSDKINVREGTDPCDIFFWYDWIIDKKK